MHNLPSEIFNQLLIDTLIFSYFCNANRISSAFLAAIIREIMSVFPFWCDCISVKMAIKSFIQNILRYLKHRSLRIFYLQQMCYYRPLSFQSTIRQLGCHFHHTAEPVIHSAVQLIVLGTYIGVGGGFSYSKIEYFWKSIHKIEGVTSVVTSINL